MNRLVKNSIFFGLILLSFHFSLLYIYKVFEQKTKLVDTFNQYEKTPVKKKFLFLGSSHTKRAVDTSIVNSSFSMAFYGQNNINAYYLLKFFLEKYPQNFEYVCLPDEFGYFSKRFSSNLDNMFFYKSFFDYKEYGTLTHSIYKSNKEALLQRFFPYINLRKMIKTQFFRKKKENIDFSSFTDKEREENAISYLEKEHGIKNSTDIYANIAITYLTKTIKLLKKHNQKAIFIKYPHTQILQNEIDKIKPYPQISDSLILHAGYEIIDFHRSMFNHDECFFDSHHLNKKGTKYASEIIQKKLSGY